LRFSIRRGFGFSSSAASQSFEEPIRSELFSAERLEQHAESLAAAQKVTAHPRVGRPLAARLRDNERVLLSAYRGIAAAIREERARLGKADEPFEYSSLSMAGPMAREELEKMAAAGVSRAVAIPWKSRHPVGLEGIDMLEDYARQIGLL